MDKVRQLIADELSIDVDAVTPDARLIQDLGADSLDALNLTMALEDEFGIEIPDEVAEKLLTVKHVCDYIESRKQEVVTL